ncbi:hypothetical protein Salmuc_01327 [Salipiger mucosus DSM 16094]|uniref:Uncharacterized protein n=2 Tax=Salipiger mucosus TaxID=263378 RepID=S9SEP8_9RHOB|nr:hypothetical protein Salmuc_01327 [Salipiger mucosus DSM 16094]
MAAIRDDLSEREAIRAEVVERLSTLDMGTSNDGTPEAPGPKF